MGLKVDCQGLKLQRDRFYKPLKRRIKKADQGPNGPNGPKCQVTHGSKFYPLTPFLRARMRKVESRAVRAVRAVIAA